MSCIHRINTAMKAGREYSPEELAVITHIPAYEVSRCLRLLEGGGLIEKTQSGHFLKYRKFKTRQRSLLN